MTTRTILLTLALSVAPLYAQQPPPPAAEVFPALVAPLPQETTATPEQRAAVFNSLALLSPEVSDFAVLTRVGDNLLHLAESGKLPEFDAGDLPAELLALDNITLATTPATPATYALLRHALVSLGTVGSSLELAEEWASDARSELSDAIIESLILHADTTSALPEDTAGGTHLPASYIILTTKPGEEALLQECKAHLLSGLQEEGHPGVTPINEENGFSGIRLNVVETYREELEEATQNMAPRRKAQLLDELARHPLCILTRRQGNALIVALCENPQELKLAGTPAESLLSTDKLAACDAHLAQGMIAAACISPELAAIGNAANSQPSIQLVNGISSVFTRLAEQEPANAQAYSKAAAALSFMGSELQKLTRPITRPTFMQLWCDGNLHLTATGDAQGCSYRAGRLSLTSMADAPMTSFYAESTPMELGITPPSSGELLEAAFSAAEGFALTLADEDRAQAEAVLTTAKAFTPEMRSLAAAASTTAEGLDGHVALVVDATHGMLPPISESTPEQTEANIPRFSLYAGVKDRSKLAQGWEALLAAAGQVAAKFGAPPEIVGLLPISSQTVGGIVNYSLALPISTAETIPSLAVSDTGMAFGTSSQLNLKVMESATGTLPFEGCAFALKFAPLAKTLRSLATAIDPNPEEAEPVATSKVRLENHNDTLTVALIGGEDGPTSTFVAAQRSQVQETADQLSTAAAIFEHAAAIADGVYGTSTIKDGQYNLHLEVKMK